MASQGSRVGLDAAVSIVGAAIVIYLLYRVPYSYGHVLLLGLGLLLVYIGLWRFIGRLVHKRANTVLRGELDDFVGLVRRLYSAKTHGDSAGIHETKAALRASTERIISAAAKLSEGSPAPRM